jgi:hypothetical protein
VRGYTSRCCTVYVAYQRDEAGVIDPRHKRGRQRVWCDGNTTSCADTVGQDKATVRKTETSELPASCMNGKNKRGMVNSITIDSILSSTVSFHSPLHINGGYQRVSLNKKKEAPSMYS